MTFAGKRRVSKGNRFIVGGLSSLTAAIVVHPIDLIKIRLQLIGELQKNQNLSNRLSNAISQVYRNGGVRGFYDGLSGSILRQLTYRSTSLGLYGTIKEAFGAKDGEAVGFGVKVACGMASGGIGSAVGNPFDLIMVRMQADRRLPEAERRNYKHAIDGLTRIVREEGVYTLWRGCGPTVIRAMLLTSSQLAVYDHIKEMLLHANFKDGLSMQLSCSMIAGVVTTITTTPVDLAKTRIMNQKSQKAGGGTLYKGLFDCLWKTFRAEGFRGIYKGVIPTYVRLAPYTVVTLMAFEQYSKFFAEPVSE